MSTPKARTTSKTSDSDVKKTAAKPKPKKSGSPKATKYPKTTKKPGAKTPRPKKVPQPVPPPLLEEIKTVIGGTVREVLESYGLRRSRVQARGMNGVPVNPMPALPDSVRPSAPVRSPVVSPLSLVRSAPGALIEVAELEQARRSAFPDVPGMDRAMCLLRCEHPLNNQVWLGTGVMIGQRTILTVAHNLFNRFAESVGDRTPAQLTRVTVFPGPHQGSGLSAQVSSDRCWFPPEWENVVRDSTYSNNSRDPSPYDYGIINLPDDTEWDELTPLGFTNIDDPPFTADWFGLATTYLFGYPSQSTDPIFPSFGTAFPSEGMYLTYPMIAKKGQSGGPVYVYYREDGIMRALLVAVQSMTFNSEFSPFSLGVLMISDTVTRIRQNALEPFVRHPTV